MRRTAIILAIGSVIVPFTWAYFATTTLYQRAHAEGVYVCGLAALGNFLLASLGCTIMSASAATIGFVAYRRLPDPRPKRRLLEVLALGLPVLVVGGYAAILMFAP